MTLASFIQLRDVVCVSYDIYTAFLSNRSVCITHAGAREGVLCRGCCGGVNRIEIE